MQTEEFYKKISENLENSDYTPNWNKSDVWQRIEQKNADKSLSVWWKSLAAVMFLTSMVGAYLLIKPEKSSSVSQINSMPAIVQVDATKLELAKPLQVPEKQDFTPTRIASKKSSNQIKYSAEKPISQSEIIHEEVIAQENFDEMIITDNGEQQIAYENITEKNEPVLLPPMRMLFRPKPIEKVAPPVKREKVSILEIPDDEDTYVANASENKRHKRKNKGTKEGKKELETAENTTKTNKIWAFVKESFTNESSLSDSTQK